MNKVIEDVPTRSGNRFCVLVKESGSPVIIRPYLRLGDPGSKYSVWLVPEEDGYELPDIVDGEPIAGQSEEGWRKLDQVSLSDESVSYRAKMVGLRRILDLLPPGNDGEVFLYRVHYAGWKTALIGPWADSRGAAERFINDHA